MLRTGHQHHAKQADQAASGKKVLTGKERHSQIITADRQIFKSIASKMLDYPFNRFMA
jgi:hypothetical protein